MAINPLTGLEYTPEELQNETINASMNEAYKPQTTTPEQVKSLMDVAMYAPKPYAMTIKTPKTKAGVMARGIQAFQEGAYGASQAEQANTTNALKQEQLRLAAVPKESVNKEVNYSNMEDKVRKEFQNRAVVKSISDVGVKYEQLRNLLKSATNTGDMAAVFNLMKTLDPTSVVRESEFMQARKAGSLWEKAKSIYTEVIGKGELTEQQRLEFAKTADALYSAWQGAYDSEKEYYTALAKHKGVDPTYVVRTFAPALGIETDLGKTQKEQKEVKTEVKPATPTGKAADKKYEGAF